MTALELHNRLRFEKSPYLLQHATNPVAWQPWDEQALELASTWQRPIFLSIGYSTCHWCHVMAEESFCDNQVAELLNRHYIAIKVDREERPDLDTIYMRACQMLIGHGGWPLNLLLTPTGRPFYALTYVPRLGRAGSPGLIDILTRIASLWQEQPDNLNQAASEIVSSLRESDEHQPEQPLEAALLTTAADNLRKQYDQQQGGFGQPPKFPQPHNLSLLLRLSQRLEAPDLERMAVETLRRIDCGGITDQLGGGLHRYSVDARWLVPHFEKMLYDQALISDAYLDAWQVTADPLFSKAVMRVCSYVLRDLGHPQGGFYCGEDADSEGHEGTFYLWSTEELKEALNELEFSRFAHIYGITPAGNFSGKNILHRDPLGAVEQPTSGSQPNNLDVDLDAIRARLKRLRQQRPRPHLDDKLLTGWNGLMIAVLARAGRLLPCSEYLAAAERAWQFLRDHLSEDGLLLRRYRDGDAAIDAFHEDYAYLIRGLIELFLSTGKHDYLQAALDQQSNCDALFGDDQGGYYDAAKPFANELGRSRSRQDGALPAAASVTAHNLLRLARITGRQTLAERAVTLLRQHLNLAADHPTAFAFLLQALDLALSKPLTLVVVKPDDQALQQQWLKILRQFRPNLIPLVISSASKLADLVPHCAGKTTIGDATTAWLCTENSCLPPVTEANQLESLLQGQDSLKTLSR